MLLVARSAPEDTKSLVDFSLWDFCPWVRTAWSFVALGPALRRNPSHLIPSNKTSLRNYAERRNCSCRKLVLERFGTRSVRSGSIDEDVKSCTEREGFRGVRHRRRTDDPPGYGQQDRDSAAVRDGVRCLDLASVYAIAFGCRCHALFVDWNHRRVRVRDGYGFQKRVVSGPGATLFAIGRAGIGRDLVCTRDPFSGNCDSIGEPDIWHIACSVTRVSFRADSGDTEFPAGDCRGDGRNHAVLFAGICAGYLWYSF